MDISTSPKVLPSKPLTGFFPSWFHTTFCSRCIEMPTQDINRSFPPKLRWPVLSTINPRYVGYIQRLWLYRYLLAYLMLISWTYASLSSGDGLTSGILRTSVQSCFFPFFLNYFHWLLLTLRTATPFRLLHQETWHKLRKLAGAM